MWARLAAILEKVSRGGLASLDDRELEDLGRLYRAAATHLALLGSFGASARSKEYLNRIVARAHAVIYGRPRKGHNLRLYLLSFLTFPMTIRRMAPYHLLSAGLLVAGGLYGYLGSAADPEWALEVIPLGDDRTPYASREDLLETLLVGRPRAAGEDGADLSGTKALFASFLWQHNTKIALAAFFGGLLLGLPTAAALLFNGVFLGVYTRTFHARGLAYEWWAWILPHGVTELLAVVLLAGGGLYLGRQIIAPGERTRGQALRESRGDAARIVMFAFPMLLAAALIESFVRQSGLSDPGRYVFAAASALFWVLYLGLAGVPERWTLRMEERRTRAERAVPLPVGEELLPRNW
jgi:uncharacterized membrane protein SpoIIM required for sporulation